MMSKENDGPAFPIVHPDGSGVQYYGMTLRDYFAAKALATASAYSSEDVATWDAEDFAKHAYSLADAMLAARSQS